jgi:hypothetical protein
MTVTDPAPARGSEVLTDGDDTTCWSFPPPRGDVSCNPSVNIFYHTFTVSRNVTNKYNEDLLIHLKTSGVSAASMATWVIISVNSRPLITTHIVRRPCDVVASDATINNAIIYRYESQSPDANEYLQSRESKNIICQESPMNMHG